MKLLIFFVPFLIVAPSCHKPCTPKQYSLSGGVANVYPDKDSIHVGDTLWFNCSIPANLKYRVGNNSDSGNYNIKDATNFRTEFHLTTPVGINMQLGGMDSFKIIQAKGSLQSNQLIPDASKIISFEQDNDKYIVSIGLIAQKKGIYVLIILDISQAMIKCDKLSVAILMNNMDNHLHYLKDIYYGGGAINPLDSTHDYCFKVY